MSDNIRSFHNIFDSTSVTTHLPVISAPTKKIRLRFGLSHGWPLIESLYNKHPVLLYTTLGCMGLGVLVGIFMSFRKLFRRDQLVPRDRSAPEPSPLLDEDAETQELPPRAPVNNEGEIQTIDEPNQLMNPSGTSEQQDQKQEEENVPKRHEEQLEKAPGDIHEKSPGLAAPEIHEKPTKVVTPKGPKVQSVAAVVEMHEESRQVVAPERHHEKLGEVVTSNEHEKQQNLVSADTQEEPGRVVVPEIDEKPKEVVNPARHVEQVDPKRHGEEQECDFESNNNHSGAISGDKSEQEEFESERSSDKQQVLHWIEKTKEILRDHAVEAEEVEPEKECDSESDDYYLGVLYGYESKQDEDEQRVKLWIKETKKMLRKKTAKALFQAKKCKPKNDENQQQESDSETDEEES